MLADTYTDYYVSASPWLILWTAIVVAALIGGVVTALKGRWGWVVAGLLLVGFVWLFTAWLPAAPGSWWARHHRTRAE